MQRFFFLTLLLVIAFSGRTENCGDVFDLKRWDYADSNDREKLLSAVERRHFTPKVENLIQGESTSEVMEDLAYTLNKFPNHYRALQAVMRYEEKLGGQLPQLEGKGFVQSVDCYFQRAMQFRPNDGRVHQLYGIYAYKKGEYQRAVNRFMEAYELLPSPELHYNIGLAYFAMGDFHQAKLNAEKAYAAGFPLTGLKDKLTEKGVSLH